MIVSKLVGLLNQSHSSKFDAHADPLFKELKMLKLDSIIRFHICKLMFLYRHGLPPESFDMFPLNNEIHSYNTKSRCFFSLPYCRTNIGKFSIRFQGPKLFNSVNEDIRNSSGQRSLVFLKIEIVSVNVITYIFFC